MDKHSIKIFTFGLANTRVNFSCGGKNNFTPSLGGSDCDRRCPLDEKNKLLFRQLLNILRT